MTKAISFMRITFVVLVFALFIQKMAFAGPVLYENVHAPYTHTPDGYQLRTFHFQGVRLHLALMIRESHGYLSYREYLTPFGPVSISQSRDPIGWITRFPAQPRALTTQSDRTEVPVLANGTTPHGADWYLVNLDGRWRLHLQFAGGFADLWITTNTPLASVALIAAGLY